MLSPRVPVTKSAMEIFIWLWRPCLGVALRRYCWVWTSKPNQEITKRDTKMIQKAAPVEFPFSSFFFLALRKPFGSMSLAHGNSECNEVVNRSGRSLHLGLGRLGSARVTCCFCFDLQLHLLPSSVEAPLVVPALWRSAECCPDHNLHMAAHPSWLPSQFYILNICERLHWSLSVQVFISVFFWQRLHRIFWDSHSPPCSRPPDWRGF